MFLILQITFTILSALCIAAVIPVCFFDWGWGAFIGLVAALFFVFMKICKTQVEIERAKNNTLPQKDESEAENNDENP